MATRAREVVALDLAKFNEMKMSDDVIVLDISAAWCGPCKAFTDVFHEVAGGYDDVVFATIDSDAEPELSGAFEVTAIPTVAVMRGGALIFMREGSLSASALNHVVRQARALDVAEIRKSAGTEKETEQNRDTR